MNLNSCRISSINSTWAMWKHCRPKTSKENSAREKGFFQSSRRIPSSTNQNKSQSQYGELSKKQPLQQYDLHGFFPFGQILVINSTTNATPLKMNGWNLKITNRKGKKSNWFSPPWLWVQNVNFASYTKIQIAGFCHLENSRKANGFGHHQFNYIPYTPEI